MDGWEDGGDMGGDEGGETVTRINCMKKTIFN